MKVPLGILSRGGGRQEDQVIDEDGNTHKIYSQGGDIYYKNDIGSNINLPFIRWNDPVRLTDTQMPAFHPRIEISDGFVYGTWIQKHPGEDRFNYAGSLLEDAEKWGSPIDVVEVPESLTGYKYEMEVVDGMVMLCWDGECELSWTADIDGDMIPDIEDDNPLEYDVENDHVDFEPDVVSIDPELDVSVALAFEGEDDVLPLIEEVEGDFEHSIGRYVNIDVETDSEYRALVKSGYGWSENASEYLRVYREDEEGWFVVTDWEDDEYTGVNVEQEHSWAIVNSLGTFTLASANEIDGDNDGLSDLTEGTEPEELSDTVYTHSSFDDLNFEDEEAVTHLNLSFEEYSIYTVTGGYIELRAVDQPVEDLELDVGANGKVNWRSTMPLEDSTRVGQIWKPINVYIFENYINTCETHLEVPFVFTSSNDAPFEMSYADVQVEQRITSNYEVDTSGDGLWDGWQDRNADMTYERAGADGVLGTEHDNIPGALAYGLDPTEEHLIGGPGRSEVQTYYEGMSSVNAVSGNLMLRDRDLGFSSLAHDIAVERTYNSQSDHDGVFGPGWQMNHEQRLEFEDDDPVYVDEAGTRYEFEHLGDGTYEPSVDNPYSLVANLPDPPEKPGLSLDTKGTDFICVELTQVESAEEYELRIDGHYPEILDHDPSVSTQTVCWDGLEPGTEYEITARSIDEYGQTSAWNYLTVMTGDVEPMESDPEVMVQSTTSTSDDDLDVYYVVRSTDGMRRYFDEVGLLTNIVDKNGNELYFTYDNDDNLITVSDDTGKELSLSYTDGHLSSVTDPVGRTVHYSYDSEGYLIEYTDAMDNTYRYVYENGLIDRVYEPAREIVVDGETKTVRMYKEYEFIDDPVEGMLNSTVQGYTELIEEYEESRFISGLDYDDYPGHTYLTDASGNETLDVFDGPEAVRIKHENAVGDQSYFEYDGELNNDVVIDKKGGEWTADHGPLGTTESFTTSLDEVEYWDWEIADNEEEFMAVISEYIDEMGYQWLNEFDDDFNKIQTTDSSGSVTEYEYTDDGQMSKRIEPNGAVWEYEYDEHGNLVKEIDPEGAVTEHEYDAVNRRIKTVSPNGAVTEYVYDELDREVEVIDAYGNTEESVYDAVGNLVEHTDKLGATTTYEYDHYGRLVRETDALGNSMEYEYDERDNIIKETNRRGFPTYREYDEMNRLVREEDRWGNNETYEYDEFHNVVKRTDKMGNVWESEYDEVGRLIGEYNPLGQGTQYEYDEAGNMIKEIDAMGYVTSYEYDSEGRLVRTLGAEGSEVLYEYDEVGNRVSVTQVGDEVNSKWQYEYDLLGRKEKEITPLGEEYTWEYDEVGNTVRYETPSGDVTEYEYDLLNRLTLVELPDAVDIDIEYTLFEKEREEYDHPPRLTYLHPYAPQITTQSQEYDLLGRLSRESWQVNGDEYEISYVYDEEGNVIEMTDQLGEVTSYTYDCRNRLRSVTDPDGDMTQYNYDPANRLTETVYPTGARILRDYDEANRLTKISNVRSDSSLISSFEYEYDANGRRTLMREADGSETSYEYDGEGRLTHVDHPGETAVGYDYDRRSNIIKRTYYEGNEVENEVISEYDEGNRLVNMDGVEFEYDEEGNQLGVDSDGDSTFLSTYLNGEKMNLRTGVEPDEEAGIPSTSYSYSLDGRRVGKEIAWDEDDTTEWERIHYLYDGQNVLYEYGSDHPTVRYTHPLTCDGGVCGPTSHFFVDAPISASIDGEKYYYLYDGLGSVTELIDEDENVVNRYRYTVFGESIYKEEDVFNPYQYTGRRYDNETGQYYYRARMYSPQQSRFISNDPMGMVDGPNMYAYVRNDPVNARDPSGCFANPMGPPPRTFNGAGGGTDLEECPGSGYETYDACVSAQHGTPPAGYDSVAEYCSHICYEQESTSTGGSSGSVLPEPPAGAECEITNHWWGNTLYCNKKAAEYIAYISGVISFSATMLSKLGVTAPITGQVAVGAGIISVHAGTCAIIGKGMVINFPLVGSPIPWCE